MHRTTIMLPDELRQLAAERAHRARISVGELIRKALTRELGAERGNADAFLSDRRVLKGKTPSDAVSRHDDYLYGGRD